MLCHAYLRSALKEHKGSVLDAIMEVIVGDAPKESSKDNIECTFQEFKLAVKSCEDGIYLYDVSDEYLKRMYESFKRVNGQNIGSAMTSNYSWLDNEDSGFIEVHIAIKSNTHKQDIKSILKTNHWHLEINGMGVLIDGDFTDSVVTDESFWAIESPGILTMYLRKGRTMKRLWIVGISHFYHIFDLCCSTSRISLSGFLLVIAYGNFLFLF